jgi:leucyl aminopeptidase
MTGPAWTGDASGDGGTGFGARTLLSLLLPEA